MAAIYRVIDQSPPHGASEFAAPNPAEALWLFGVDPAGTTAEQLDPRVTKFSLPGVAWLVVHLRDQEN